MGKPVVYNATLVGRLDLSPTLALFRVLPDDVPPPDRPWFESGQYVSLGLNVDDAAAPHATLRPYSIASAPEERRWLELYIRLAAVPESPEPFTPLLWPLAVGARLYASPKIAGRFTETHTVGAADPRVRVCAGAGTGIAPFVSAARSAAARGRDDLLARVVVLHGASHAHELGYREELVALGPRGLLYLPTISRPADNPGWPGRVGRVETAFDDLHVAEMERTLGLRRPFGPRDAVIYVCGFTGTITATVLRLLRRGFIPEDRRLRRLLQVPESAAPSLFYEQYDTAPIVDPKDEARLAELRADVRARLAGEGPGA
jgi:ferredoxin--NADP+ reductase